MPRKPDERYEKAMELYKSGAKLVEIATQLDLPEGTVRRWKSTHKWDSERSDKKKANARKRGGQPGNKNATGPPGNKHAEKHGFFSKWLPEETKEIIGEMKSLDPLDILWDNIQLQFAAIIRAQNLMHVTDQEDTTKEISMNGNATAYDIQYAWDKHATFMSAQSRAMKTLESMLKQYDEMLNKNWENVSAEQKARLELLQVQKKKLEQDNSKEAAESVVIIDDIPDTSGTK